MSALDNPPNLTFPTSMTDTLTMTGVWTFTKRDASGNVVSKNVYKNIIPTVGRAALAAMLAGSSTYDSVITYVAVGTDATAPANGDTTLGTEYARKPIAGASAASNVLTVDGFFNESEANTTLNEAGLFGDGSSSSASATTDSGILYSHVAISETKSASETLSVEWTLTIS